MKHLITAMLALTVLLVVSCKSREDQSNVSRLLIKPGEGIGEYRIGELVGTEGPQRNGIVVYTNQENRITKIYLSNGGFTIGDLNGEIGMDFKIIRRFFGDGVKDQTARELLGDDVWLYDGFFVVVQDDRLSGLGVIDRRNTP